MSDWKIMFFGGGKQIREIFLRVQLHWCQRAVAIPTEFTEIERVFFFKMT